jgi:hypothetical protein
MSFDLLLQWTGRGGGGYWLASQSRGRLQAGGGGCQDPPRQTDLPIIHQLYGINSQADLCGMEHRS